MTGAQLVISDAHAGLKGAIEAVLLGAAWQRCRVHFMRNVLARVPKGGSSKMVAAAIRTVFAQPDSEHVTAQLDTIAGTLGRQFPAVETMLRDAEPDLLAFTGFPPAHWKKIWSTNPLERLTKEIKRRTDVVGAFPNPAALLRLAGTVLVEAHDERQVSDRRYLSEGSLRPAPAPANPAREGSGAASPDRVIVPHRPTPSYTTRGDVTVAAAAFGLRGPRFDEHRPVTGSGALDRLRRAREARGRARCTPGASSRGRYLDTTVSPP